MQGREGAGRCDHEHRPSTRGATPLRRRSVEVSIGGLEQTSQRVIAVRATDLRTKPVQSGQHALWRDLEYRTVVAGPARKRGSIEVSIGALNQSSLRARAIRASCSADRAKTI